MNLQSVLSPHGPNAADIALLGWILFAGAAVVLLIVIAATALAMRGSARTRARLADERAVIIGGIAFPAVTLTVLLLYGAWLMAPHGRTEASSNALPIEVVGEQWWWRVIYRDAGGQPVASANEIRIPVGQDVEFTLKSADVIHSFWVPSLGGKVDMIPGRTTWLRLKADRAGVFRGQCAEYCGGPHALMAILVTAMPAEEFSAWLTREAAPAAEPATEAERRGRALFLAAGCGGCHAIRGTAAEGRIGPDLTHIGGRRSVGIDTLPMSQNNLARFIVDSQHVKPGNLMPRFRIFSDDERAALAAYLLSLR